MDNAKSVGPSAVPEMLTIAETKARYRLSHSTLFRLLASGAIKARKNGRSTLVYRASVEQAIENMPPWQPMNTRRAA